MNLSVNYNKLVEKDKVSSKLNINFVARTKCMGMEYFLRGLDEADKVVTLAMNFNGGSFADTFFYSVSNSLSWLPLGLLFCFLLYKKHGDNWRRMVAILFGLIVTVTLCDQISASIIKPLVMRPRPSHCPEICWLLHYVNGYHGGHYGFVSSHAANAFGGVAYCCIIIRRWRFTVLSFLFAAVVSYSRIYLGVHYFGDVLCGAVLGLFIGSSMSLIVIHLPFVVVKKPLLKSEVMGTR